MEIPKAPGVYLLTNKINGKIYVGKSVNLRRRIGRYKNWDSDCVINRAIRKYGFDNFKVEILEQFNEISNSELLKIEASWIRKLNSINKEIGYNTVPFGHDRTGTKCSEETKTKMSLSKRGKNNPCYGKTSPFARKVIHINLSNGIETEFDSIKSLSEFTGTGRSRLSCILLGINGDKNIVKMGFKIKYKKS